MGQTRNVGHIDKGREETLPTTVRGPATSFPAVALFPFPEFSSLALCVTDAEAGRPLNPKGRVFPAFRDPFFL